jgi:phospholipase C
MSDLKHIVILMQENRSLDHYFGTLPGVRGFSDKQALRFQDGTTVFQQKDASGKIVTPQVDDGTWGNDHGAWGDVNHRKWDLWVQHNGAECMNYHSDAFMGFYHSVAAQYTIVQLRPSLDHGARATPAGRHRLATVLRQQRQRPAGLHQHMGW